jgi:hypothetical protein
MIVVIAIVLGLNGLSILLTKKDVFEHIFGKLLPEKYARWLAAACYFGIAAVCLAYD